MPCSHPRSRLLLLSTAAALIVGGYAVAQAAGPSPDSLLVCAPPPGREQSPFLGEWELDLSRMPDTYGPPPKRVVFTFEDLGGGKWSTRVDITAPDGSVRHVAVQYLRDGRAVRGEGDDSEGDSAAFSSPAPDTLVMSQARNKSLQGVRVYTISADGKEMTESASGVNQEGMPFVRTFHFRRIR